MTEQNLKNEIKEYPLSNEIIDSFQKELKQYIIDLKNVYNTRLEHNKMILGIEL